jgi:hypothetical protein
VASYIRHGPGNGDHAAHAVLAPSIQAPLEYVVSFLDVCVPIRKFDGGYCAENDRPGFGPMNLNR